MREKLLKTFFIAVTYPGALLIPYLCGIVDGAVALGGAYLVTRTDHWIIGGLMLLYFITAATLNTKVASSKDIK